MGLMGANKFIYASAVRIGTLKFIATMSATKDVLALASAEFDVSAVEEGQTITVKWHLHAFRMCANCQRRRLRRLVLPLPRLPLRRLGPHPQGSGAPEPRDPALQVHGRREFAGGLVSERLLSPPI